jgi:hypothetical protein
MIGGAFFVNGIILVVILCTNPCFNISIAIRQANMNTKAEPSSVNDVLEAEVRQTSSTTVVTLRTAAVY